MHNSKIAVALLAAFGLVSLPSFAEPEVKVTGFLSAIGGAVLHGSLQGPYSSNPDVNCPCYLSDWSNFGVYEQKFSLAPESRIGVQAVAKVTDDLSFTGQVVSRGTTPAPSLQWAYASYKLTPDWEVQVGRKRIPLYYYSDFQDIGFSYPWVSPPAELYGWDATNFNGVSLRNKSSLAGASISSGIFAGSEKVTDSRYFLASGQKNTDVRWDNIVGGDMEVSKDWLTVRAVYVQANTLFTDKSGANAEYGQQMQSYGVAVNADFEEIFVLTEVGTNNRTQNDNGLIVKAPVYTVGVGYRWGDWTPFLNYARYSEISSDETLYTPQFYDRSSLTVRYDLNSSSDIKAQIDRYVEPHQVSTGDATILRISYDLVF